MCSDNPEKGKFAYTSYKVMRIYGNYSLVLFRIHTGRTHQIRVHSRYLGCPVLGDPIYGKKDVNFPDATLMLHAKKLRIRLPEEGRFRTFKAPLPGRFKKIICELRK
nr:pseudouridine synthase [Brucepastera parasyntrophica]